MNIDLSLYTHALQHNHKTTLAFSYGYISYNIAKVYIINWSALLSHFDNAIRVTKIIKKLQIIPSQIQKLTQVGR